MIDWLLGFIHTMNFEHEPPMGQGAFTDERACWVCRLLLRRWHQA